jgi:hypothetical protein
MTADPLGALILGVSDGQTTRLKNSLLIAQLDVVSTLFEAHHHIPQAQVNHHDHDLGKLI